MGEKLWLVGGRSAASVQHALAALSWVSRALKVF